MTGAKETTRARMPAREWGDRVLGVGSPLLDLLARVDDAFLETIPGEKGGMLMVDADFQQSVLARLPGNPQRVETALHL